MTAHRRPLLLFAAAAALVFPACLSFPIHTTTPATPQETRDKVAAEAAARAKEGTKQTDFGVFPSRPGDAVAKNGGKFGKDAKDSVSQKAPDSGEPRPPTIPTGGNVPAEPPGPFPIPPIQPAPLPEPLLLQIVRAQLEGGTERALELMKALDPANQEIVLAVLPALTRGATADLASGSGRQCAVGGPVPTAAGTTRVALGARRRERRAVPQGLRLRAVRAVARGPAVPPERPRQLYLEVRNLVSQPATGPRARRT